MCVKEKEKKVFPTFLSSVILKIENLEGARENLKFVKFPVCASQHLDGRWK